jgi:chromosomal replication initiator protein
MRAWENFLQKQRDELGSQIVQKWLDPLKVVRFDAGNIYLEAKDHFQALWFEEHVRKKAEQELYTNDHRKIKIHLSIANVRPGAKTSKREKKQKQNQNLNEKKPFKLSFDELDPYCYFETFVQNDSNLIPYKLMMEIIKYQTNQNSVDFSEKELITFNPIYIYGPTGTGKTHLLMATANALKQSGINAIYTRAETFTDHVVSAIRAGEMSTFRQTYRNAEVLIIDDVHVFSRRGATQEELFHTFNTLHLSGKQIILTASCMPQDLQYIEPRLISRFEWGIVLPVTPPSSEDLKQLLSKKMSILNFPLNRKASQFLLETFHSNAKTLTRALEALVLRSDPHEVESSSPQKITVAAIKHLLSDLIEEEKKSELTADKILMTCAEHYGITVQDIIGKSQRKESVLPRKIAMFLCRDKLSIPYMKIGDLFERDHSTVMSSIKRIEKDIQSGRSELMSSVSAINNKLQ